MAIIIDFKTGKVIMSEQEKKERAEYKFVASGRGKTHEIPQWRMREIQDVWPNKQWIVCAAIKSVDGTVITGTRHAMCKNISENLY